LCGSSRNIDSAEIIGSEIEARARSFRRSREGTGAEHIGEALLLGTRVAVMTAGPDARIRTEIDVDLPRPRTVGSEAFSEAVRMLEGLIEEEVNVAPSKVS
jgi:hypothetical protein